MTIEADILLTNATVLTMDGELTLFDPGAVAIKGDSLVAVGAEKDLKKSVQAAETFDCQMKILMPGLVNAHTHVPMTLLPRPGGRSAARRLAPRLYDARRARVCLPRICPPGHPDRLR